MRDENLRRRGIDPEDNEAQIKEIEARGREILEDYKVQKEYDMISTEEAKEILEPVENHWKDLGVALGMLLFYIITCLNVCAAMLLIL